MKVQKKQRKDASNITTEEEKKMEFGATGILIGLMIALALAAFDLLEACIIATFL